MKTQKNEEKQAQNEPQIAKVSLKEIPKLRRASFKFGQFVVLRKAKIGTLRINLPERFLREYGWNKGDYLQVIINCPEKNCITFKKFDKHVE
jgi:hypothetical protein